jgi:hypothetical protein
MGKMRMTVRQSASAARKSRSKKEEVGSLEIGIDEVGVVIDGLAIVGDGTAQPVMCLTRVQAIGTAYAAVSVWGRQRIRSPSSATAWAESITNNERSNGTARNMVY